jgi:O-antigen/teichoic acid export membrane protein
MIKNVIWGFTGGMATGLFAFIGSVFVARNLDVDHYGILQLATTYYVFLQLIENFSNHNVVRLEMIKNKEHAWQIACASAQVIFACYTLALMALICGYFLFPNDILLYVIIMTLGQLLRVSLGIVYYFDVRLEAQWSQISSTLGSFFQSAYRIVTSFNGEILWQSFAIIVGNGVSLFSSIVALKRNHRELKIRIVSSQKAWEIFYKSYPMMMVAVVTTLIYKLDIVILGYYGQTAQISYYSNAVKFAEPWNFVAASIIVAMSPNIINCKTVSLRKYYRYLRYLFFILTITAVGLASVVSFFAEFIVLHTYGAKYIESAAMLRIHVWSNVFLFWMLAQQVWEVNEGMKRFLFIKTVIGVFLNFALNFTLIPIYGGMGCVIASMVTYFYVAFIGNLFHRKARFLAMQLIMGVFDKNAVIYFWTKLKSSLKRS